MSRGVVPHWQASGHDLVVTTKNKLDVRAQVLTCTNCSLHAKCNSPVPFSGNIPSEYAVLGEAPGKEEDRLGYPFVGQSGKLLKSSMLNVGLDPQQFCFINTASCFPNTDGKGRAPMLAEVNACSENREAQLAAAGARWIILTGNVPLQAYRPDLRIGKAHGKPLVRGERVYLPIYHPAAVLRNRTWMTEFEADLTTFKGMIERKSWAWVPSRCISCGVSEEEMDEERVDDWGVVTCGDC